MFRAVLDALSTWTIPVLLAGIPLLALLGRQLRLQRRIGEFFVESGFLDEDDLDEIRRRLTRHNARWAR